MTASRIKAIVVFVLMATSFGIATAWKPTQHMVDQRAKIDLEKLFPRSFGDWVVDDRMPVQLVSPDTEALLNKIYNQVLTRTYVNAKGQRIMLSVAYGGDQSDATKAHRPEVCYPAQGFQIVASAFGTVGAAGVSVPVRQLVARQGGRTEPISYWVTVGDKIANSGTEQKLAQLGYTTRGVVPDGMLVRVSNISADTSASFALHQSFIDEMALAMPSQYRGRVLGSERLPT
jgi:EpsI family protein